MTKVLKTIDNTHVLNNIENDKFYSPENLAERFQVSLSSIYKLLRSGGLPHIRLGKIYRIPATDLGRYLARQAKNISVGRKPKIPKAADFFIRKLQKSSLAQNVLEVWLFGSYARGDYDLNSDIDLLVVLKSKDVPSSEILIDLSERAMESTDYEELIAVKEVEAGEWAAMKKDKVGFVQAVEGEGVLLWKNL